VKIVVEDSLLPFMPQNSSSFVFQTAMNFGIKGLVHPKIKIMSLITHPHVVPTP